MQKGLKKKQADKDLDQVNLDTVLHQYYKQCKDTFNIDTSLVYKGNLLRVKFLHYCTNDSRIQLPQKYLEPYKLKEFITHDFESHLLIRRSKQPILQINIAIMARSCRIRSFQMGQGLNNMTMAHDSSMLRSEDGLQ